MDSIDIIGIILIVVASVALIVYLIGEKNDWKKDIEIDNIYNQLNDNKKLSEDIEKYHQKEFKKMRRNLHVSKEEL